MIGEKNSFPTMLKRYLKALDIQIIKAEKIAHEESLSSSIFKLRLQDHAHVILKITFDEKRWKREIYFLEETKKYIKVPRILSVISPQKGLKAAIVMEYIKGDLLSSSSLSQNQSFQMGQLLARFHSIPVSCYGDVANQECLEKNMKSALFLLQENFQKSLKECSGELDPTLLKKAKKYVEDSSKKITYLDGPCIVHRDFKPGNIIVNNGEIQGVIDWENAKYSFAEEDFSQMEYLVWEQYPALKQAFLAGYQSIRKIPDMENIMPLLRVCKAFGAIGFTLVRKKSTHFIDWCF